MRHKTFMVKNSLLPFITALLLFPICLSAQKLVYKLNSKAVIRKWSLSSKAYRLEEALNGAIIELFEGDKQLATTTSDAEGNFTLNLPSTGNYLMVIRKSGYNTRKFSINCNSIIIKNGESNFIPSVNMTGFIGDKSIKDVGDMSLSHPSVQMMDDKNEIIKYGGLNFPVNVNDGEVRLIQKFCTCNKLGDLAMQNKNYALAKKYYQMARMIMDKEEYPIEQLKRAEDGLKEQMLAEKTSRNTGASKVKTTKPITQKQTQVSPASSTSQKSSSSGRKVLPVIGGKR